MALILKEMFLLLQQPQVQFVIIITVMIDLSWRPLKIIFWVQKFNVEIYVHQKIKCTSEASTSVTIK